MTDSINLFYQILRNLNSDNIDADHIAIPDIDTIRVIAAAKERVSPRYIDSLDEDSDVFVFGSNEEGCHDGRASEMAKKRFGAVEGKGEGLFGRSYALPTTRCDDTVESGKASYSIDEIKQHVDRFLEVASNNKDRTFYVTRVGCGWAFHDDEEIAPLFREALKMPNVYLPQSFLDVLFEVKTDVDHPYRMVPSKYKDVKSFINALDYQFSQYIMLLKQMYCKKTKGFQYDEAFLKVLDRVEKLCNAIVASVDLTMRGLPALGFNTLSDELKKLQNEESPILPFDEVAANHTFYRMRVETDNMKKKDIDADGMFHIPFSLRGMVKTQRYSVPGYPCLYMGERAFGCWEELGRPNLNSCLISRVENVKSFKVLDLSIPDKPEWESKNGELPVKTIVMFPLIIACTFRQSDHNACFKPEYIIPQFLLEYVKDYGFQQNLDKNKKDSIIYGIKYTSVHFSPREYNNASSFNEEQKAYENYVIPVVSIKNEHCSRLSSVFKLSKPICEEFERVRGNNANGKPAKDGISGPSIFRKLESILAKADTHHID